MQLAQYLLCVATRHEQAKDEHEEELKELRLVEKMKSRRRNFTMTFEDEAALLKVVIGSVRGKPVVLVVQTGQMHRDGIHFYLSENDVWLTEYVPAGYIGLKGPIE